MHTDSGTAPASIDDQVTDYDLLVAAAQLGNPWPLIEYQWGRLITAADVMADPELPRRLTEAGVQFLILDDFQIRTLDALFSLDIREVYVKGNTGCGKGAVAGIACCVYFLIWDDARIVITRDTHKTAVGVAYREVETWWRRMADQPAWATVLTSGMVDSRSRRHQIAVANPDSDEGFSGVHAEHVLYWFDEATAQSLAGRFSLAQTQASKFLAMANPRVTHGPFKRAFDVAADPDQTQVVLGPYGKRLLVTVDGADMLNVRLRRLEHPIAPQGGIEIDGRAFTAGETIPRDLFQRVGRIIPGQTGYDTWLGHKQNPDRNWVLCFAHGRFPPEDPEKQVILGSWLRGPQALWRRLTETRERLRGRDPASFAHKAMSKLWPVQAFGLDVGASTKGDASVLVAGGDRGVVALHQLRQPSSVDIANWVIDTARTTYGIDLTSGAVPVAVDVVGVGIGVSSILRAKSVLVIEIRGNDPSIDPKRYANKRAETYGELGERLRPDGEYGNGNADAPAVATFTIPDDPLLEQELCAPEKVPRGADGLCFAITPKRKPQGAPEGTQSVEDKIGRSPDRGDAVVYWWRAMQARGIDLSEWLDSGGFF